jgi:hypothetical protein
MICYKPDLPIIAADHCRRLASCPATATATATALLYVIAGYTIDGRVCFFPDASSLLLLLLLSLLPLPLSLLLLLSLLL